MQQKQKGKFSILTRLLNPEKYLVFLEMPQWHIADGMQ